MFTRTVYGVLVPFLQQVSKNQLDPVPLTTLFEVFSAHPDVTLFMPTTTAGVIAANSNSDGATQWTGSASTINQMLGTLLFWPQMSSAAHTAVLGLRMRSQGTPPPFCISYALVQATAGVGTVLIWYVCRCSAATKDMGLVTNSPVTLGHGHICCECLPT